jgi:glycosyltransferase involved in cell wall biosynthesis
VVASPVGVNVNIVHHGENGFLATDEAAWRDALERMIASPALRERMGAAGRARVEAEYSLEAQVPRLADILRRAGHA